MEETLRDGGAGLNRMLAAELSWVDGGGCRSRWGAGSGLWDLRCWRLRKDGGGESATPSWERFLGTGGDGWPPALLSAWTQGFIWTPGPHVGPPGGPLPVLPWLCPASPADFWLLAFHP